MARKKEVIEQEWLKAEAALAAAHKECSDKALTDSDLATYKAKYQTWKNLLVEAQKKIGEWKNEKDKKRLDWMKVVASRAKVDPLHVKEIAKAETRLKGAKALAELISGLTDNATAAIGKAEEALKLAHGAIAKKDYDTAASEHGKALNALKNASGQVTKGGATQQVANQARAKGCTPADVDTNNAAYRSKLQALQARFATASATADHLGDEIDKLEAEALNAREVASPNQDPTYKAHLKKCFEDYRAVLAFATKTMAQMKTLEANIPKLEGVVARTVTKETVPPVVGSALQLFDQMYKTYKALDTHIQQTIRTDQSTLVRQAVGWGITGPDRVKNLQPLVNRAFSTNFQVKAMQEKAADRLQDSLELLAKKFGSAEAAAGAQKLERGGA
jgi:hypothetical protein